MDILNVFRLARNFSGSAPVNVERIGQLWIAVFGELRTIL